MGEKRRAGPGSGRLQMERETRPDRLQQQTRLLQSAKRRRRTLQMHRGPRAGRHVPHRRSGRTMFDILFQRLKPSLHNSVILKG